MKRFITLGTFSLMIVGLLAFAPITQDPTKPAPKKINIAISHGHCNAPLTAEVSAVIRKTDDEHQDLLVDFSFNSSSLAFNGNKDDNLARGFRADNQFGEDKEVAFRADDIFPLGDNWFQIRGKMTIKGKTEVERFRATKIFDDDGNLFKYVIEGEVELSKYGIYREEQFAQFPVSTDHIMFVNFVVDPNNC